jgi:hypothetical protein
MRVNPFQQHNGVGNNTKPIEYTVLFSLMGLLLDFELRLEPCRHVWFVYNGTKKDVKNNGDNSYIEGYTLQIYYSFSFLFVMCLSCVRSKN